MSNTTVHRNGRDRTGRNLADQTHQDEPVSTTSEFPAPQVLSASEPLVWDEGAPAMENYVALGRRLAKADDLFRKAQHASGLMLASPCALIHPTPIVTGKRLAPVIADRVRIVVVKNGKAVGGMPSATHLNTMLAAEVFLQQFRAIDQVVTVPMYSSGFTLTSPGFNNLGIGDRIYFAGQQVAAETDHEAISRFLDVMEFASEADRTNAVAAALTVKFRNHWAGAKPLIAVTSSKSHGGKETIIDFAAGRTPHTSLSHEKQDWALQKNFAGVIHQNPEIGLLNFENVRLDGQDRTLSSSFLERFLTDPEPVIFSTGTYLREEQRRALDVTGNRTRGCPCRLYLAHR